MDNSEESTFGTGENQQANQYVCSNTTDKIFLLGEKEATDSGYGFAAYDQFGTDSTRIRVTTDYTKATGAYQSSTEGCGGWWWLCSPNCRGEYYARVIDDGSNANDYNDVSLTRGRRCSGFVCSVAVGDSSRS